MNSKTITREELCGLFDHTNLKAYAQEEDFKKLCDEAAANHFAMVAINSAPVALCHKLLKGSGVHVGAAISFPLGQTTVNTKAFEAEQAIKDGADEIDTVINLGDVKNKEYGQILAELKAIRAAAEGRILKVIIETCYLTEEEKRQLCRVVTESGADYIKTSTGFGTEGAVLVYIFLFKEEIGPDVKIKAAGGMHSRQDFIDFLNAGCDRLGTSSAVKVLETPE